jgi:hypothetical protein
MSAPVTRHHPCHCYTCLACRDQARVVLQVAGTAVGGDSSAPGAAAVVEVEVVAPVRCQLVSMQLWYAGAATVLFWCSSSDARWLFGFSPKGIVDDNLLCMLLPPTLSCIQDQCFCVPQGLNLMCCTHLLPSAGWAHYHQSVYGYK